MALIDLITDGTDTINLASATDGFTDKYSYKQQIVEKDVLGEYPLVTERLSVNWNQLDDDERADEHAKLMRLKRKANKWGNKNYREGPVWRKLQSNSEDNPKYMVLTNAHIVELSETFYGPDTASKPVVLEITREGAPRLIEPGAAWRSIVSSQTVYDYNASGSVSWVTVPPGTSASQLPGDADGITKITVTPGSYDYESDNQVIIAKRTADTEAELNGFIPHFNPVSLSETDASLSGEYDLPADANVPGGYSLEITNGVGSEQRWYFLWAYDPDYYQGKFMMVVPIQMVGATDYCHLTPIHDQSSSFSGIDGKDVLGPEVYVPAGADSIYQRIVVAHISLPYPGNLPPGESFPSAYRLGFIIRIPNGSDCYIRDWHLIPVDEGVQEIRSIGENSGAFSMNKLIVDGSLKHTYLRNSLNVIVPSAVDPGGRYLTADHQKYTRFYFYKGYWDTAKNVDAVKDALTSMTVDVDAVPRVKALAS